jgi:hypothetical protein
MIVFEQEATEKTEIKSRCKICDTHATANHNRSFPHHNCKKNHAEAQGPQRFKENLEH